MNLSRLTLFKQWTSFQCPKVALLAAGSLGRHATPLGDAKLFSFLPFSRKFSTYGSQGSDSARNNVIILLSTIYISNLKFSVSKICLHRGIGNWHWFWSCVILRG